MELSKNVKQAIERKLLSQMCLVKLLIYTFYKYGRL
jgi:hypothetical protein